jgi:hypothetical protein
MTTAVGTTLNPEGLKIVVGKPDEKRQLGRPTIRENNIKINLSSKHRHVYTRNW